MNTIFNMDNPFWSTMEKVFDVFVLNCCWLLCCIPIVTIGPSITALYYASIGMIRGDGNGYPWKDFFKSFKLNLKQGMALGIPLTVIGALLIWAIYLCYHNYTDFNTFFLFFFIVMAIIWLAVTLYVLPLLAKFDRKNIDLIIWAFTMCIKHLPRTIAMMAIVVAAVWICKFLPGLIFIIGGCVVMANAALLCPIFRPYIPEPEDEEQP